MYRVLVPVDQNVEQALSQVDYVVNLPNATDAIEVTVAHAYSDDANQRSTAEDLPPDENPAVSRSKLQLQEAGIENRFQELYHPVQDGIVDLADELDVDQIVIGGRKRSPAGKALFGSVTQGVILNASVPVTVVGVDESR